MLGSSTEAWGKSSSVRSQKESQMHWADLELAVQPRVNLNSRLRLSAGIAGIHIMLDFCNAGGGGGTKPQG